LEELFIKELLSNLVFFILFDKCISLPIHSCFPSVPTLATTPAFVPVSRFVVPRQNMFFFFE